MKKTGLPEILTALENEQPVIKVPKDIAEKAMMAVKRMMEVPRDKA
jgi:quinolinate synthase